jgi:hypothetical protein
MLENVILLPSVRTVSSRLDETLAVWPVVVRLLSERKSLRKR